MLINHIFACHKTILQMSKNGMKLGPDHNRNPFTKVDRVTNKKQLVDVIGPYDVYVVKDGNHQRNPHSQCGHRRRYWQPL